MHLAQDGYPTDRTYWLIVAWNRRTDEYKYFLSNAPPTTALELLLRVAFRRAKIEHLFRLAKDQVGLDHFEGRSYVGLMRHMILCQTVLLFVAEQTGRLNAEAEQTGRLNAEMAAPAPPPAHATRGEKKHARPDPDPQAPTPGTADRHPHRAACHHGADGRRPQLALCPLA